MSLTPNRTLVERPCVWRMGNNLIAAMVLTLPLTSCHQAEQNDSKSQTEKAVAKVLEEELAATKYYTPSSGVAVASFKANTADLIDAAKFKERIQELLEKHAKETMARLHVAVWPDQDESGQENLSESRYIAVRDVLRAAIPGIDTETYYFSDRANWLERKIGVNEEKVKELMASLESGKKIPSNSLAGELAQQFHQHGEAGKVVVVVELREERASE